MTRFECPREQEVLSASRAAGWRDVWDENLKKHLDECEICRDVAAVAEVLREDHELTLKDSQLPLAGQVWWRAAVRARAEASHAAVRPLTWVHGIAAACAIGLGAGVIGYVLPGATFVQERLSAIAFRIDPTGTMVADVVEAAQARLPLVFAALACLILMPIVLYFALKDEEGGR